MQYKRADRIAAVIKVQINEIIMRELHDADLGFITITKVHVSDDIRHAKIFYSILGNEEKKKNAHNVLLKAKGLIRSELAHRIKVRFVPEIDFHYDDSAEYAEHIQVLLNKIKEEDSLNKK
ncbi:MAG TPA: 30S ribosome-binding factor RbfA [bacterium]|nr:30S ribosome-binding factor RbfA [bacterium]HPN45340.1 30S ribosome-binding factor RbfA [bacterium]